MPSRRVNPQRVKQHRYYSVSELADCCDVHKNTVRHWQASGLEPIEPRKPYLFHGATAREYLARRNARRRRPCRPGTFYCFKCRQPMPPALGMVEFTRHNATTGDLSALCGTCGTVMHRRVREALIGTVMPNLDVQIRQAGERLLERRSPSLNCDNRKD